MDWFIDNLALVMFVVMFFVIFCGYPVAFVLGGTALVFATIGWAFDVFPFIGMSNIILRMWGGVAADPVLVSIPMFIFMGSILQRSGSAKDMLGATEILLKRVPGGLAVAVMVMGTIPIFLLGFPFEWIEICLIVLPVFVPILAKLNFADHIGNAGVFMCWFGTLVAVNLQTSFMTPPFGATLFYLKGTVPAGVTMGDVYRGMWPFVAIQILGLILCLAFPDIILWLPRKAGLLD